MRKIGERMTAVGIWLKREYLQGDIIDRQDACSNCGYTSGHVFSNWNYCPVCGTRMFNTIDEAKKCEKQMRNNKNCYFYDIL